MANVQSRGSDYFLVQENDTCPLNILPELIVYVRLTLGVLEKKKKRAMVRKGTVWWPLPEL